jgi:hypothetical protein
MSVIKGVGQAERRVSTAAAAAAAGTVGVGQGGRIDGDLGGVTSRISKIASDIHRQSPTAPMQSPKGRSRTQCSNFKGEGVVKEEGFSERGGEGAGLLDMSKQEQGAGARKARQGKARTSCKRYPGRVGSTFSAVVGLLCVLRGTYIGSGYGDPGTFKGKLSHPSRGRSGLAERYSGSTEWKCVPLGMG